MSKLCSKVNSILKSLKSGKASSLKELYDLTFHHLKVIAMTYAEDKNDWEDILQEAFIRVDKYVNTFNTHKDGYNWMCKIVQNVAYDSYKRKKPQPEYIHISFDSLEDSILEKNALLFEISKFPQEDQRLLYLKFWECKTIREIAEELNIPRSTAYQRIANLVKELGENLK